MDLTTYAEAVETMRLLQKEYFQKRQPGILTQAKTYEKLVDRMTDEILGKQPTNQLNIFEQ